ncbi:hypothetical protein FB451DRAFT_1415470 [Mycena latifolia]|nr:hypothetical protein FB451DRAFT_1415470 [Mycena latifolia]
MFSGDPEKSADPNSVTPSTFIKKFCAHMRNLTGQTDADRINALVDYLEEDSPAEKWYKDLKARQTPPAPTTWNEWEAAFMARFPRPQKAERTPQEWERELAGMKLKVEDLDTRVQVGGANVFAHINFASKLLETARLAGIDTSTAGIWQSRDALPEVLREKVPATQTNWTTYMDAIKAVDRTHIRKGVAKAKKAQEMEHVVRELAAQDRGRHTQSAPTTPVTKMSSQLAQTALSTPKAPAATTNANPFGAGGGRGNLFTPGRDNETLTSEELARMRKVVDQLSRSLLNDDGPGRAEYVRRVGVWNTATAGTRPRLELTGYPLSPGTVVPGSGECYGCGKITTPWHRKTECPGPKIDAKETTFRTLVAKYLRAAPAPVNVVLDWMDFGEEIDDEGFPEGPSE